MEILFNSAPLQEVEGDVSFFATIDNGYLYSIRLNGRRIKEIWPGNGTPIEIAHNRRTEIEEYVQVRPENLKIYNPEQKDVASSGNSRCYEFLL